MKRSLRGLFAVLLILSPGLLRGEIGPKPKTWRALVEEGVLFAASTAQYWSSYQRFTIDWQFTWRTFGRKFFTPESPRLDSNAFWYNWSHGGAGGGYYLMARTNGLSSPVSTLFSLGASTVWETVTEWREIISINDMIFTTFGGPAMAEPLFQVGSYFSHRKGLVNRALGFLTNPFLAVNNWFDRHERAARNSAPDPDWHRFRIAAGFRLDSISPAGTTAVARAGAGLPGFVFGVDLETISVPGYGRGGSFSRSLHDTLGSRIRLAVSSSAIGFEEFDLRTQAVLFGMARQSAAGEAGGPVRGGGASLGFATGFEIFRKRPVAWYDGNNEVEVGRLATEGDGRLERPVPARFTDKLAAMSPLGAVVRVSRFGPRLHVRWTTEVFADFALVNALAYDRYTETHDPGGVKTTLLNWGYYYGAGITLASEAAAEWRRWHAEAVIRFQGYGSIQGLDRYQYAGLVTDDFRLADSRLCWRFRLGFRIPRTPVEAGLAAEGIRRRGSLPGIVEKYREDRLTFELAWIF
jgi:hypothetical protein